MTMERTLSTEEIRKYKKAQLSMGRILPLAIEVIIMLSFISKIINIFNDFDMTMGSVLRVIGYLGALFIVLILSMGSIARFHEGLKIEQHLGLLVGEVKKMTIADNNKGLKRFNIVMTPDQAYKYDDTFSRFIEADLQPSQIRDHYITTTQDVYNTLNEGDRVECVVGMMSSTMYDVRKG